MPKSLVWPRVIPNLRYMDRTYLGVIEIFFTFFFMKTQCLTLEFKLHYNILLMLTPQTYVQAASNQALELLGHSEG